MILSLHKNQPSPDLCRLEFTGKLMMGNDSRQVEWAITELLAAGVLKVILDLQKLDGIDSTGVGIIVVCHGKVQKAGGHLCVAGAQGIVLETLHMTHVDRLMQIFPTAEVAEKSFVPA
jgi:anti-sigma B factor antagonist